MSADDVHYGVWKCALKRFETRDINNSNDVRKFFKVDGYDVTGYYQLLVKSMHKKVLKGTKWMPRRILPMKDVEDCDKLWLAVNKRLTQRCPNGETPRELCRETHI